MDRALGGKIKNFFKTKNTLIQRKGDHKEEYIFKKKSLQWKKFENYQEDFPSRWTRLSVKQELCIYSKNKLILYTNWFFGSYNQVFARKFIFSFKRSGEGKIFGRPCSEKKPRFQGKSTSQGTFVWLRSRTLLGHSWMPRWKKFLWCKETKMLQMGRVNARGRN